MSAWDAEAVREKLAEALYPVAHPRLAEIYPWSDLGDTASPYGANLKAAHYWLVDTAMPFLTAAHADGARAMRDRAVALIREHILWPREDVARAIAALEPEQ